MTRDNKEIFYQYALWFICIAFLKTYIHELLKYTIVAASLAFSDLVIDEERCAEKKGKTTSSL